MQIPDSTICSLLNQGEEKGMEYLFTRYYKPLVLWAASFLNNIPQSEDLVQDFFIRLWEKRTPNLPTSNHLQIFSLHFCTQSGI